MLKNLKAGRLVSALVVIASLGAVLGPSTAAGDATAECPPVPPYKGPADPVFYDYVSTYRSACAARENWDRRFDDVTVTAKVDGRVPISVTTSSALAGAVASLKVGGKEFIGSGGHGAALQYAFHAWQAGGAASECYNPTQAGSQLDDAQSEPPFHDPSTSALYRMTGTGATVSAGSRMAMFIERSDPRTGWGGCRATDYQPDRLPYSVGLSPYWLDTTVRLAPDHGLEGLDNVIQMSATVTSEDQLHAHFSAVLVAYLQRDFVRTYTYDLAKGTLREFTGSAASAQPAIRCTANGAYCLGIYFRPAVQPGAYYYTMTREPMAYNAFIGEFTTQMTAPTTNVGIGGRTKVHYETYFAVGNLQRVAGTLTELHRQAP